MKVYLLSIFSQEQTKTTPFEGTSTFVYLPQHAYPYSKMCYIPDQSRNPTELKFVKQSLYSRVSHFAPTYKCEWTTSTRSTGDFDQYLCRNICKTRSSSQTRGDSKPYVWWHLNALVCLIFVYNLKFN